MMRPITHGTGSHSNDLIGVEMGQSAGDGGEDFYLAGGSPPAQTAAKLAASLRNAAAASLPSSGDGAMSALQDLVADLLPADTSGGGSGSETGGLGTGIAGTGTGSLSGSGSGRGRGVNQTTTNFLGVEGTGSSFVYVLDRSDSMNAIQGAPMYLAKRELLKSIASLSEGNQFQIVFYNDTPNALDAARGGKNRMLFAEDSEKQRTEDFVRNIVASGGTEHVPALRIGLSYAPDVLFFMTDGERPGISESELADVRQRAAKSGTTIHTIQFSSGPQRGSGGWIRALAEFNRGVYRYVDIDELTIGP